MKNAIPEAVLQQHTAFLGKTGSGKTSTAKLAVEQIVRNNPAARICVMDPIKSDWWGLTSSADGKRPGLPFHILGGPRGHVPLHDSAGKAIGELVANGSLPLSIIDMADFEAGGLQKFFNDFAPALMKHMRGVVHLVIEEAHEFAPKERSGIGAESMAIHNAKKLATAGRSKGIRMMVLTQRTQALHNALLGSCDTMIAHRLTAPADQEPVKKWLKANVDKDIFEKVSASLSSLKTGSGWICSGEAQVAELVQFPKITTYDNSATPTGEMGDHEVKTAPVDQDRLRAIIGDAVKQAEADDPRKLRAEISRLSIELSKQPKADAALSSVERATIYETGIGAGRSHIRGVFSDFRRNLVSLLDGTAAEMERLVDLSLSTANQPGPLPTSAPSVLPTSIVRAPMPPVNPTLGPRPAPPVASGDGTLPTSARKMLAVLDVNPPVRRSWTQVATLAGLKSRGGSFNTARKALLESGLLHADGNLISIIKPSAGATRGRLSPSDLVDMWCANLSGAAPKLLRMLFENGGAMTQTAVAAALDIQPRGGSWNTAWKELRDNEIVRVSGGNAELTELFQP